MYNTSIYWVTQNQSCNNKFQVGDGHTDHYCWQRPEDMTTSRQAYKVDQNHPGSDVAGETAAAMAAASIVFRKTNPHYSHLLLHHAQQVSKLINNRLLYNAVGTIFTKCHLRTLGYYN